MERGGKLVGTHNSEPMGGGGMKLSVTSHETIKQPSEHYYLSHATFPFPRNHFLRPAVVYSRFLAFGVIFWLLISYALLYYLSNL
jgi:hypothetical protein